MYRLSHNNRKDNKMAKLEKGDKFKITYYSNKDQKTITRNASWNEQCREWISKAGSLLLTYYDDDARGFRTAKGNYMISLKGGIK
jgi:hypothetical protein